MGTSGKSVDEPDEKEAITLLAAASTADALKEVAALFEKSSGATVSIAAGASNALARQIIAGAPADVFVSANEKWADELKAQGLAADVRPLLSNRLVLVVPKGNPAGVRIPKDLTSAAVQRIALAGENVPAGAYADQALRALNLSDALADAGKIVRGQDVRVTLSYVERGEAEAGVVYATDARGTDNVETVYTFERTVHDALVYPAVLVRRENASPQAKRFFDYLSSPDAKDVFERYGFAPAGDSPPGVR